MHKASDRADKPLVVVNCAALPEDLLEAELFGTEPGAFTGAVNRIGRCEMADSGTLFLDELGELSKKLQVKLLRFLQEHTFERLGGKKTLSVDVRVIAATNRDLREMVQKGEFREDLYYRLWVYPIELPALRERKEDIPALVDHFLNVFTIQLGVKERPLVEPEVYDVLKSHEWRGNIRQLENVVQRLVVENRGRTISVDDLPQEVSGSRKKILKIAKDPLNRLMAEVPRDYAQLKRRRNELQELAGDLRAGARGPVRGRRARADRRQHLSRRQGVRHAPDAHPQEPSVPQGQGHSRPVAARATPPGGTTRCSGRLHTSVRSGSSFSPEKRDQWGFRQLASPLQSYKGIWGVMDGSWSGRAQWLVCGGERVLIQHPDTDEGRRPLVSRPGASGLRRETTPATWLRNHP